MFDLSCRNNAPSSRGHVIINGLNRLALKKRYLVLPPPRVQAVFHEVPPPPRPTPDLKITVVGVSPRHPECLNLLPSCWPRSYLYAHW